MVDEGMDEWVTEHVAWHIADASMYICKEEAEKGPRVLISLL